MQIGMRQIPFETAEWFRAACSGGGLTRSALARGLCEREGWRSPAGRLCLASARKLLPRLAGELGVRLPEARATDLEPHARPAPDFPDRAVSCRLAELGALSLEPAASPDERRRWEAMIETHHPQGWRRPPGGQVRYWIRSEHRGLLGGVGFCAGRDAARPARQVRRLVGRRPGGQHRHGGVQQPVPAAARRPGQGAGLAGAAAGGRPDCRRLGGGVWSPPGAGAELHRAGAVGAELPGGGLEVLPGAGVRPPQRGSPGGVAQAAGGGLAGEPVPRAGAASRLVRPAPLRGRMGRAGVCPRHAPGRPGQAPDRPGWAPPGPGGSASICRRSSRAGRSRRRPTGCCRTDR